MKGQLNTLLKTDSTMESCITMQPITRKLYCFPIWAVLLLVLSGCAMNTPNKPDFSHTFGVSGVAFSPDGKRVAVGTRDRIWVADTVTRETTAGSSLQPVMAQVFLSVRLIREKQPVNYPRNIL